MGAEVSLLPEVNGRTTMELTRLLGECRVIELVVSVSTNFNALLAQFQNSVLSKLIVGRGCDEPESSR